MTSSWKSKIRGYRQHDGTWRWHWSIPTGTSTQGGLAAPTTFITGSTGSQPEAMQTVRLFLAGWTS